MQNFIEIHQRNPELLSSGGFRPPRLDRGIERPRLDRVNTHSRITCRSSPEISKTLGFGHSSAIIVSGPHSLLSEFEIHSVQRCLLVDY